MLHAAQRTRILFALITLCAASAIVWTAHRHVSAHSGHDGAEVGEFDLDAPRSVSPQTAKHIGLQVEEIAVRPLEEVLEITGIVRPHPDHHRTLVSRVAGRLLNMKVHVGAAVKKGDLLAEIDSPELARNLYEARKLQVDYEKLLLDLHRREGDVMRHEREIEALNAQLAVARRDLERVTAVAGQGVSLREVDARKADVAKLEGDVKARGVDVEVARRDVAGLKRQADALKLSHQAVLAINNLDESSPDGQPVQSLFRVLAESDGIVVERAALPGSWVQTGQTLLRIADYSLVQVEGELPESLIRRVQERKSNKVRVRPASDPSLVLEGTLRYIAPELEPVKRTAHLLIDVPNTNGMLRTEMWTSIAIVLREAKNALLVPRSAVVTQGPMHFVFVEIENADPKSGEPAIYQKKDIDPGIRNDQHVEVRDGVFPTDRVVSQGAYSLTQLRPKPAPATAKPAKPTAPAKHSHGGHSH